ncbi:MAG TPA: FAD-dependent oxidoreductase [Acidimicrobiia bacterium]|nr:FAD-dependent oxidoreductase [Acidimicrobiia bacterium]
MTRFPHLRYPKLFEPLRVGPLELRNRVVFGAHFTMFTEPNPVWGEPGFYGRRYGRYLADRARGGVAVVIAGETAVSPNTAYKMPNNANGWDPGCIPHYEQLTSQVHEHDALAFVQLTHSGAMMLGNWSKEVAVAPSVSPDHMEAPRAMDARDIAESIEYHVRCAQHAVAGGFDGIEIQSAHGYLLHQFLTPKYNYRTDAYGGSIENRMRFGVEVVSAVRDAVGDQVAVGLRLAGDDEQTHGPGLTADDCAEIAARYEELGLVDFLNVSVGIGGIGMVRTNYTPHAFGVYAAHAIKKAVRDTPVFAVHRILTPEEAEQILGNHEADGITLVRALIADPEWVNKAREDRDDEIRRCTGINQSCYGNLLQSMPINCVQNPAVGREDDLGLGTMEPAATKKKVVVVGGGPGGMEAASTAAARGHDVTLLEKEDELGGNLRWAAQLPGREEIWEIARWRIGECERQGVDVHLGVEATVDSVLALGPDAVIVATGGHATKVGRAAYHPMPVPGSEADWVLDHVEALKAHLASPGGLGSRVVLLDAVGHAQAIGLGELLATAGAEAICVTPLPMPMALDGESASAILPRAVQAGMQWRPNTVLGFIGDHEVTLFDVLSHRTETITDVDTVVIRTHGLPNDDLTAALDGKVPEVVAIGDAVAVRLVDRAVYDGHVAARAL